MRRGTRWGCRTTRDPFDIMTRGFDHLNRFFTLVEPPHAGRPTPMPFRRTRSLAGAASVRDGWPSAGGCSRIRGPGETSRHPGP